MNTCVYGMSSSRKRTSGALEANGQGGQLPTQFLALTNNIEYIVNVILSCPFHCLPTQILNDSYSIKEVSKSKENFVNVI